MSESFLIQTPNFSMDSIFVLSKEDRSAFLQLMIRSVGCSYICLWSCLPQPINCLWFLDGIYRETSAQQSRSSPGSRARGLFNMYRESVNSVDNGKIPGFAFKNNLPYMELKFCDLQRMISSEAQFNFYQEAGIKIVVFMGCATGEIELGMTHESTTNLELEMKNLFFQTTSLLPQPADQNQLSSSSSSLKSLSFDSPPECSPLGFNIPTTALVQEQHPQQEPLIENSLKSVKLQVIQDLSQIRKFPTIETTNAAMTKAILAVLSSSSSTTNSNQNEPNLPSISRIGHKPNSFERYRPALAASVAARHHKQSMFKRAVSFFRNLNLRRMREVQIQENRPTVTQLHHMISERKRREKLNESFQALRSLLPPVSKKDKASVLSSTTEYLSSLKSQVEELNRRNQELEAQLLGTKEAIEEWDCSFSAQERLHFEMNYLSSEDAGRILDLRVSVRGDCSMLEFVGRILELLKGQRNVSLLSAQSNARIVESAAVHGVLFRLQIEGDEFDEAGFQEALRRTFDDSAP